MIQDKLKPRFGKWFHDVLIYYSFSKFWTQKLRTAALMKITFWQLFWFMAITWTQLLANHYQPELSFLCIPIFICMLCTIKSLWWISRGILVEISPIVAQDVSVLAHPSCELVVEIPGHLKLLYAVGVTALMLWMETALFVMLMVWQSW